MLAQARKILQLDTRNQRGVYMQAVIAARAKNFALARRLLEKIAVGYGELPGAQLLTAVCEYELGNPNKAIELLVPLNAAQPNNEVVRLALARALHKSGDQDAAWAAVGPWAVRSDAGSYIERLAARVLEAQNRRSEAAQYLDRAAYPSPKIGAPLMQTSLQGAATDEAAIDPGNAAIVIPRIRIALVEGNMTEARTAAARLLQGNEGVADAQLIMGDVEWMSGNRAAALAAYQKAKELSFSRGVLTRLASAYRANGNDAKASETIFAYFAYNPADVVAVRMLAFDRMDREQWAEALPLLLRVRARTGLNDSALNANIARTLSQLGRHDEAVQMARIAYRIDPASLMTTRAYGSALLKAKRDPRNARALLRKASKLAPTNEEIAAEYRAALAIKG
jgi:tetratricopeptide (TPR) repeat protein